MPAITEISTSYSRKVQLEQFEPVEHFVEVTVELDSDDDADEVYDEYSERAEDMVERAIAGRIAAKKIEADSDDE